MKSITLTKYEEIRAFLNGTFESPIVYYNSFLTMESFPDWVSRPFHVHHLVDILDGDKIVDGMIHIASLPNLPVKKGVVEFVKQYQEKSIYKIRVVEVEKIELKEILK